MRFNPPLNVHAPFYPARGPYSSSDAATIKAHVREMLAANITVMVRARRLRLSRCTLASPAASA